MSAVGTDLAALGTVGALIALGVQVWMLGQQTAELRRQNDAEARARRQDEERRADQDERDRQERHRAHARLVAAIVGPEILPTEQGGAGRTAINLINSSDEPVYRLVAGIVFIQGAAPQTLEAMLEVGQRADGVEPPSVTTVSVLPPGRHRVWIMRSGWGIMTGRIGAEVAFSDRAGHHWIRRATGRLEEIDDEPFEYFGGLGLYGPHDLQTPEQLP